MSRSPKAAPPSTIRDGKDGRQRVQVSDKRWGPAAEARFLDALAATCNVRMAAAAAGFCKEGIYARRRRDPAFAAAWAGALEQGYAALEAELLRSATEAPGARPDPPRFPDLTAREAILVLQLHRAAVRGGRPQRYDWRTRPRSLDDVRQSILRKLDCIEAARLKRLGGDPDGPQ